MLFPLLPIGSDHLVTPDIPFLPHTQTPLLHYIALPLPFCTLTGQTISVINVELL